MIVYPNCPTVGATYPVVDKFKFAVPTDVAVPPPPEYPLIADVLILFAGNVIVPAETVKPPFNVANPFIVKVPVSNSLVHVIEEPLNTHPEPSVLFVNVCDDVLST